MVYVFLADGFEEIEAVTPIDILRRAGLTVKTAAVGANPVTGAHGMRIYADMDASQARIDDAQAVLLPGGMPGTTNLENSGAVRAVLRAAVEKGIYIGAICAAPSILGHMGLLEGKRATCFPGFEGALSGAAVTGEAVVADGHIVTARGAGCAADFGFTLTALLCSPETAKGLRQSMQYEG